MFTILLVVNFITMMKSSVDIAPIAFLKVSQDQAGSFDYILTSSYSERVEDGDTNMYLDPNWKFEEDELNTN